MLDKIKAACFNSATVGLSYIGFVASFVMTNFDDIVSLVVDDGTAKLIEQVVDPAHFHNVMGLYTRGCSLLVFCARARSLRKKSEGAP